MDIFRLKPQKLTAATPLTLELIKTFHVNPHLVISHDTRVIVDNDIFDFCPISGDFIKISILNMNNVSGAVGLTRTKLLVA